MVRFRQIAAVLAIMCMSCSSTYVVQVSADGQPSVKGNLISGISEKILLSDLKSVVTETNRSDYDFTENALDYLSTISESYPDRSITDDETDNLHDAFGNWLITELTACGYNPEQIEEQTFSGESIFEEHVQGRNIILTLPGKKEGQIIAGAHYDGSGIGDNGSGTALLLAAAVNLVDTAPEYTIKIIFFDREEEGKVGSRYYAGQMTDEEVSSTLYMINCDALAFGDFCNIYGGIYGDDYDSDFMSFVEGEEAAEPDVDQLEGYELATATAEHLGFQVLRTEDLDGYFEANGHGMEPQEETFFTNPWTYEHPAPVNKEILVPSPATFGASDHAPFAVRGIPYIYFEATNWWAKP